MSTIKKGKSKTKPKTKYWSDYVTKHSFALALEANVFTWDEPRKIAESLKESAEESLNRKGTPFQSAMSMLNFYINRAGKNLKPERKRILEQAKIELRGLFNKIIVTDINNISKTGLLWLLFEARPCCGYG